MDERSKYLTRLELSPLWSRDLTDSRMVLDLIVASVGEDSDVVPSHNIGAIAFVPHSQL